MDLDGSPTRGDRPQRGARRPGEVAGMTQAEKLAAEWEARHDVAARDRRSAPDVLQHYVAHERMVEGSGSTAPPRGARRHEGRGTGDPADAGPPPTADVPVARTRRRRLRLFGWARRGG